MNPLQVEPVEPMEAENNPSPHVGSSYGAPIGKTLHTLHTLHARAMTRLDAPPPPTAECLQRRFTNLARSRPLQKGYVFAIGPSWFVQYRTDERTAAGQLVRVKKTDRICGKMEAGQKIGKREAERIAAERFIDPENRASLTPGGLVTVAEFWKGNFQRDHIDHRKVSTQNQYAYAFKQLPAELRAKPLRKIQPADLQEFIIQETARGLGSQSVTHLRNCLSAMFRLAIAQGFHTGANPVAAVRLPRMVRKVQTPLTLEEARQLIAELPSPSREVAYLSVLTGMNAAEMFGLDRQHVNLTDAPRLLDFAIVPPGCLCVVQDYYDGHLDTTKTQNRRRILPLTPRLQEMLRGLMEQALLQRPDAPLFQARNGARLDRHNLSNRQLAPAGRRLFDRSVGWHDFRRAAATYAELAQMPLHERIASMGHGSAAMTILYAAPDIERRRPFVLEVERQLNTAAAPGTEPGFWLMPAPAEKAS